MTHDLPQTEIPDPSEHIATVRYLNKHSTQIFDGAIEVKECTINGQLNPDIAEIITTVNTPIQMNQSNSDIYEIFYNLTEGCTAGAILMSPEGNLITYYFNTNIHGGARGVVVKPGWTAQIIVPQDTTLHFYEYWTPRGFMDPDGESKTYGEKNLLAVSKEDIILKFSKEAAKTLHACAIRES